MKQLITIEGKTELVKAFNKLQKEKRYWVQEKKTAADLGDLSENAEYHAAEEHIRNIDKKLFEIDSILNNAQVVDISKRNKDIVCFGSKVTLLKEDSEKVCYQIVGTNELLYLQKTNNDCLYISNLSPMGKELLRKKVGDSFVVNDFEYEILEII